MLGVGVDLSERKTSTDLNALITNLGLRGMLEGKGYQSSNVVILFVAGFIDRAK